MKKIKRDLLSGRSCFALKSLLALNLHMLLLCLMPLVSLAGVDKMTTDRFSLIITGKISDDKGLPIGEVTIAERGTNNITMSKPDGTFTITVANENSMLVFSHVGYTQQEVAVKGRQFILVRLLLTSLSMDSTIVVGYGKQKKQSLVGAISQVKGDVLERTGGVSSKADVAKGKPEFADALNGGVFTDNSQNAAFVHLAEANNQNYWYYVVNVQNRPWYWASKTIVDYMKPLNDPRLKIFADTTATGDYNGVPYGLDGNAVGTIPSASVSFIGVHVRTQNAPTYIATYGQVLFAIAEANKIGWLNGGDAEAKAKYEAGVQASFRQWNRISFKSYNDKLDKQIEKIPYAATDQGDTTGLAAYLAKPGVAYNAADAIKQIATQRWLHLYMNGYEAWAEWRRTGFPVLTPAPNNGGMPIPRRQAYPVKELNINADNYRAAIAAQPTLNGKDDLTGRVWWDAP